MAFQNENTAVIRMKRDFDSFIGNQNDSRCVKMMRQDDYDDESFIGETESVSMQALLGRISNKTLFRNLYKTIDSEGCLHLIYFI